MKKLFVAICILSLGFAPVASAQQAMSSNQYKLQSDSLNFAGDRSASVSYGLEDTAGELVSGSSTSASYGALQGYQFMQLDVLSPSAPTSISATALSSTQIEVAWGIATDDFGIDRYYVYRDGLRVANVASFPRDYMDFPLQPLTTYAYNVSAVDAAGNEGPWSATTTATTFQLPIPGGTGTPHISGLSITNWSVTTNDTNAIVSFHTSAILKTEIFWGKDTSYSEGHLAHDFSDTHLFLLNHLRPNTTYFVKVLLVNGYNQQVPYYFTFQTASVALSGQPANVTAFSATAATSTIELAWQLPQDPRVVGARIVRREDFYPTSPTDGPVIFENKDASGIESFSDTQVKKNATYYYAIFTEDLAGNFSSGVLAQTGISALENLNIVGNVDPKITKLTLKDFLFIQSGDSLPVENDLVSVVGDQNLTVALRAYHLPPVLKTIAVSMVTADYQRFTFILRPNQDHTRYEATVAPLGDPTVYKLKLDILDFANHGLRSLKGTLAVKLGELSAFFLDERSRKFFGWGMLAVSLAGVYVWFTRRRYKALNIIKEEPWTVLAEKLKQHGA